MGKEIAEAMMAAERELYSALPDAMDCSTMAHVERCDDLNFLMKKYPDRTFQIPNSQGVPVSVNQSTMTPAMVQQRLNPTMASSRALGEEITQNMNAQIHASQVWQQYISALGGSLPVFDRYAAMREVKLDEVNYEDVSVRVVIHSQCAACDGVLTALQELTEEYSDLDVYVYQLDDNPAAFDRKVRQRGLEGRIQSVDVDAYPTVVYARVIDGQQQYMNVETGAMTTVAMARNIRYAAEFDPAVTQALEDQE